MKLKLFKFSFCSFVFLSAYGLRANDFGAQRREIGALEKIADDLIASNLTMVDPETFVDLYQKFVDVTYRLKAAKSVAPPPGWRDYGARDRLHDDMARVPSAEDLNAYLKFPMSEDEFIEAATQISRLTRRQWLMATQAQNLRQNGSFRPAFTTAKLVTNDQSIVRRAVSDLFKHELSELKTTLELAGEVFAVGLWAHIPRSRHAFNGGLFSSARKYEFRDHLVLVTVLAQALSRTEELDPRADEIRAALLIESARFFRSTRGILSFTNLSLANAMTLTESFIPALIPLGTSLATFTRAAGALAVKPRQSMMQSILEVGPAKTWRLARARRDFGQTKKALLDLAARTSAEVKCGHHLELADKKRR